MKNQISNYIKKLNKAYQVNNATEHTYRIYLQELLEVLIDNKKISITNEPKRIRNVGAPDYSITYKSFEKDITENNIPIGYVEAKDIGKDISSKQYNEQFDRYKDAFENLIITDYMKFNLYRNKKLVVSISICELVNHKIVPLQTEFDTFITVIENFVNFRGITIKSAERLADMMASKAKILRDTIEKSLEDTSEEDGRTKSIHTQLGIFKKALIHDITEKQFADVYAQTVAYGMLAARIHDDTLENFTRQEAAGLIPKSNPFLRGLFSYISGIDIDDRIEWIVDSLADTFRATDVKELIKDFTKKTGHDDPLIHFYETFLGKYDPKLKKSRGVWYTPKPVVEFIVRACDDVLKSEFNIEDGLTDESKIKVKVDSPSVLLNKNGTKKKDQKIGKEVHRVQILDPATGTGTFLAETMKLIRKNFVGQESFWVDYVENDLKPRLNGFEILMASYAMAHFKLDLIYQETIAEEYRSTVPKNPKRFNVLLTNSLEKANETEMDLFSAEWLTNESVLANKIKSQNPIMVVMGNPPYSGESSNKSKFITKLMDDYKKEYDGSKLKEKNSKWLNDDYVKFIRYSEKYIEINQEGILAFITNHSYIDNPTFRGMRHHLLKTFDKIYIIDLHGNTKKKEVHPDGSKDENVFDIMQGVAIIIGIKSKVKSKKLADLYLYDIYGKRDSKYKILEENSLKSLPFEKIEYKEPNFYFFKQDFELRNIYEKGFKINELFPINSVGIVTARDKFTINDTKEIVETQINDFVSLEIEEARNKYSLGKDVRDWKVHLAQKDLLDSELNLNNIVYIKYRPFDIKCTYYTGKSKGYLCMPRGQVMKHFKKDNIALLMCRQAKASNSYKHIFIVNKIFESCVVSNKTGEINYGSPLYLYPDDNTLEEQERTPNLNLEIVKEIEEKLKLNFTNEKEDAKDTFAPIDILDYIYAVLHSPIYRDKYKEFLKIDFPRVPYPTIDTFWELVDLGSQIRKLHLMENDSLSKPIVILVGSGTNDITNRLNKKDFTIEDDIVTLQINDTQQIGNIPLIAWNFYIGGYQPAQKWLKDRHNRKLNRQDFKHYNKIIVALVETDRLMLEIDKLIIV